MLRWRVGWSRVGGVAFGEIGDAAPREVVPDLRHLVGVGVPMYVDDQPPAWTKITGLRLVATQ